MGCNTTILVLNDALDQIENDPDFGKNLVRAILTLDREGGNVSAGNHVNAATVIETHHADGNMVVVVGGNRGERLEGGYASYRATPEETAVAVLKQLGYVVYKKKR